MEKEVALSREMLKVANLITIRALDEITQKCLSILLRRLRKSSLVDWLQKMSMLQRNTKACAMIYTGVVGDKEGQD